MSYPRTVGVLGDVDMVPSEFGTMEYETAERIAICTESGISLERARIIAAKDAARRRRIALGLPLDDLNDEAMGERPKRLLKKRW